MQSIGLYCLLLTAFMANGIAGNVEPGCREKEHPTKDECVECCTTECDDCLIKYPNKECTDGQHDCGPILPEPPEWCKSKRRICVDKNCACPTKDNDNKDCDPFCEIVCKEDETFCSGNGALDARGCKIAHHCVKKIGDCDGICSPLNCPPLCLPCPEPVEANGCASSGKCVEFVSKCAPGVCPVHCSVGEIECGGEDKDEKGCGVAGTCVTCGTDNDGAVCNPCHCPVVCKPSEILCPGQVLPNGCKTADVCHPKAPDVNGAYCPDTSASHGCEVICKPGQTKCPGHTDQLGCKEADVCKDLTKDKNDNYCPSTSICHSPCKVNEISCAGGLDVNGCKKPDVCLPKVPDYTGAFCPIHCPEQCNENQITCSGCICHSNGCKDPDVCVQKEKKLCGPDKDGVCSGTCPVHCNANEVKCPSQLDPCDCCPTEEVCRPAAKNIDGVKCADKSASHNCPKICDELNGEVLCPAYEDNLGCKPEAVCKVRAKGDDGNDCPAHSVCPKQCENNEILCGCGVDPNNCKRADKCIPKGKDLDGILCAIPCPPVCDEKTQVLCLGQTKANGCKGDDVCVAKVIGKDGEQCKQVCQVVQCTAAEVVIDGGLDTNGCPLDNTCGVPKTFGDWTNDGPCNADGDLKTCGPGTQQQVRTCTDGTKDECTDAEKQRVITCAVALTPLPACPTACVNGDVKLKEDNTPMIFWDNVWSPICGHYFWDTTWGPTMFCQQMGYDKCASQTAAGEGTTTAVDAFWVGKCLGTDNWKTKCTGTCSDYTLGGLCSESSFSSCSKGQPVEIKVTCTGTSFLASPISCIESAEREEELEKHLGAWTNDDAE